MIGRIKKSDKMRKVESLKEEVGKTEGSYANAFAHRYYTDCNMAAIPQRMIFLSLCCLIMKVCD